MAPRLAGCVLASLVAVVAASCGSSNSSPTGPEPPPPDPVPFIRVAGTVWMTCRVNPTEPDSYSDPIAGVTVSTSLDAQTTTTDASGRFSLETRTRPTMGQNPSYTLTFTGAGVSFSVSMSGAAIEGRNFSPNDCPRPS